MKKEVRPGRTLIPSPTLVTAEPSGPQELGGNLRGEDLAEAVHSLPQRAHAAFTLRAADA